LCKLSKLLVIHKWPGCKKNPCKVYHFNLKFSKEYCQQLRLGNFPYIMLIMTSLTYYEYAVLYTYFIHTYDDIIQIIEYEEKQQNCTITIAPQGIY